MIMNVSQLSLLIVVATFSFAVICHCKPLSDQMRRKNENGRFKKSGGTEVQGILNMIEDAMNEAPIGSRPKQVRFSVVGKRNSEDLESILREIESELAEDSSGSRSVPVRFSLSGKK